MTINIRDFAYPTYDIASRKRAASEEWQVLDYTRDGKRPRHSSSDAAQLPCDAEARFEAAAVDGMLYLLEATQLDEALAPTQPPKTFDPAYDPYYHFQRRRNMVDEVASSILCESPREALGYFKRNDKRIRRRIKHVSFTAKALAFGPSQNGIHWRGICNYIQDYMCIETVTIPVPYDPFPMLTAMVAEDDTTYQPEDSESFFFLGNRL
jgi:hypothetical protein